jgi:tetratricopeptide (TPR) repeat protein
LATALPAGGLPANAGQRLWLRAGTPWPALALINLLLAPSLFYGLQSDDTDTFYHLAAGRQMAEAGGVLDREVASFTIPGRPWTNYSWLFQRLLYAAHRVAGVPGVLAVRSLFLWLLVNLLFLLLWRCSGKRPLPTLALALLGVGLVSQRALQVRPHLASYVCLAALLLVIDHVPARAWRGALYGFAICAAWASLHGIGYPVGLAAVLVSAVAASLPRPGGPVASFGAPEPRRLWLLLLACAAGFLANPFGLRLAVAPRVAADAEAMSQIGEMGRLALSSFAYLSANLELRSLALVNVVVLAGLLLLPTGVAARAWRSLGWFVLGLGLLLFRGRRMVPELAILALPAIAEWLALRLAAGAGASLRRGLQAVAAYLVLAALFTTWRDARAGLFEPLSDRLPHGPIALLQRLDFRGHVFADATHAGLVSWRLPHARIFMDMRMPEPFSAQEAWLYKAVGGDVSLASVDRRYTIDAVLVRLDSTLARGLRNDAQGFGLAYADHNWTLFVRESVLAARPELRMSYLAELERIADGGAPGAEVDRNRLAREVDRLIEIWSGNHLAQRAWLWLRTNGGQPLEAARAARALALRHRRVPVYPFVEGLAFVAAGRPEEAALAFEAALRVDPGHDPAYPALARTLAGLGRTPRALAVLEEFQERRRYRLDAADSALLAWLRREQGKLPQAADAYERALWLTPATDPQRPRLELELAELCLRIGRPERALELSEAALIAGRGGEAARALKERALAAQGAARP